MTRTLPTVLILAAGESKRFFPLNAGGHKGAFVLHGKPLLIHTIEGLKREGFREIVVVGSASDHTLMELLQTWQMDQGVTFVEQPTAKGMADAVLCANVHITGDLAITFPYAIHAGQMLSTLCGERMEDGAVALQETDTPWLFGIAQVTDGKITSITEKPAKESMSHGLKVSHAYVLSHAFLDTLAPHREEQYGFETALDVFVKDHAVAGITHSVPLPTLKYPWHLFAIEELLFGSLPRTYISPYASVAPTVVIDTEHGPVYVENGAVVAHYSRLVGPVYIGKDAYVGDFSLIRHTSMEEGSKVGAHSEVARSIIGPHSSMHTGFIGDSIIGSHVKLGSGFLSSNKRLDRANVMTTVNDEKVDTGTNSLGTVIGDESQIGVRTNTMPGVLIGARSVVYPSLTVFENLAVDSTLKQKR